MHLEQNKKYFDDIALSVIKKLKVMLVDDHADRAVLLEQTLLENGYEVIKLLSAIGLAQEVTKHNPDIIIVDVDSPDRDILEHMANLNDSNPHPMVMLAQHDTNETLQRSIHAGVSTYILNDLNPQIVKSIVEVAIERFGEYQTLRNELEHTKNQLAERKLLERAKALLMQHSHMSEDEAYKAMRKMAMDNCQRMATVSKNIIDIMAFIKPTVRKVTEHG